MLVRPRSTCTVMKQLAPPAVQMREPLSKYKNLPRHVPLTTMINGMVNFKLIFLQECSELSVSDWHHKFTIPEQNRFSGSVQRAIETGIISSKARREIVQVLRTMITAHTAYPTSEQYITISQKLITKFPKLTDAIGTNGFVSDG